MPMLEHLDSSTSIVLAPVWTGSEFEDADAQAYWIMMPSTLSTLARAELGNGNVVSQILRNRKSRISLVEFERGPTTSAPDPELLRVHREHEYGNYCYEGTTCTYEDLESGSFLAFNDPMFDAAV
jgi:hypothetical protein